MWLPISLVFVQTALVGPNSLDFWIGDWELTGRSRNAPGKDAWTETVATNQIRKVMKGMVIEENFKMTGFAGKSSSVYFAPKNVWRQTWVDDTGAYLLFEGGLEDGHMVLNLTNGTPGTKMRMTWRDVTKNQLTWLWQRSTNEGKDWETQWELRYKRKADKM